MGEMDHEQSLQLNGQLSRAMRVKVNPQADFREVIRILQEISIPPTSVSVEHIRFAILELLNNSIRAHRERGESRDICIDLAVTDGKLVVSIRDFGGGFDPGKLPYDLSADLTALDLHSRPFEEYQKNNGYKRFGMGIYVAKKTFDEFHLEFFDSQNRPSAWMPGSVAGTFITLSAGMRKTAEAAHGK